MIALKKIRVFGRPAKALLNFMYHHLRYCKYAAWRSDMSDARKREYHVIKIYHSIEKSMSYKSRRIGSGWKDAYLLLDILRIARDSGNVTPGDRAARTVLEKFLRLDGNSNTRDANAIGGSLVDIVFPDVDKVGVLSFSETDFKKGVLEDPEAFFESRYSLREFKDECVEEGLVRRAAYLALKTPSVCNRQPWHLYTTSDKKIIESALSLQNGNRGFGHKVPNLAILAVDLRAFMAADESYQHWIDGGLFSMSFIYALHSLGVASCCLNWSASPSQDKALRRLIEVDSHHSVIMMLAYGFPSEDNFVCASTRRSIDEVLSPMTLKV